MASSPPHAIGELCADPFGERHSRRLALHKTLLGAHFVFRSDSQDLLDRVDAAFDRLPPHRLPGPAAELQLELRLLPGRHLPDAAEPPPVQMQSGMGLLFGMVNAANYVAISPSQRQALLVVSEDMLDFPYHLRYELIEFAVLVLATRCLGLAPLHGACVGANGRGVLLLGDSGAGKSTLALHALLHGLELLAEDAVFVEPQRLLATGLANFVHVQAEGLQWIDDPRARRWIECSPVIRRRSGVQKFEADLRAWPGRIAPAPLELAAVVFVSAEAGDSTALLRPLPKDETAIRLRKEQPYAAGQAGWEHFQQQLLPLRTYELRRGTHPRVLVAALHELLDRQAAA
jgi:hypothetical protein